jgi:hypothetical protein
MEILGVSMLAAITPVLRRSIYRLIPKSGFVRLRDLSWKAQGPPARPTMHSQSDPSVSQWVTFQPYNRAHIFCGACDTRWINMFEPPVLTSHRVRLAYTVGVTTDVLQFALGPLGWAFADELLDIGATIVMWRILGFHPLLLPTFVLEFLPLTDMLPTWTGCVALVVALRKKQPVSHETGQVIDVEAKHVD